MKRILMSENERSRILNMHTSYRLINEAYTGTKNAGYDTIEACKKELPYQVVAKAKLNWNTVKQAWGSTGSAQDNLALRNAFCDGWRPGDQKPGTDTGTPGATTPTAGEQPQYKETFTEPTFQTPKAD
jgi:hypothetical protein